MSIKTIPVKVIAGPFRWVRKNHLKITRAEIAQLLGTTEHEIQRLESGRKIPEGNFITRIMSAGLLMIYTINKHNNTIEQTSPVSQLNDTQMCATL